jgi:O-antigen ligase
MKFKEGVKIKTAIEYIKKDIDRFLLICLAASLPFDRIPSFDVYGISIRLSLIFSVLIIFRVLYIFLKNKKKPEFNLSDKLLLMFIAWTALVIPVSINLTRAFSVFIFIAFIIITAFSISFIFKKEYFKPISTALFCVTAIVVLFGIYQYIGDIFNLPTSLTGLGDRYTWSVFGFPRIQAFSLEPLYMSAFLLIPYSIASTQWLLSKRIFSLKILGAIIFISSFAIFLSVSRGGIYALVFSSSAIGMYMLFTKKAEIKRIIQLFGILVAAFLISLLMINYLNKTPSAFTGGKKGSSAYVEQIQNTSIGEGDERSRARLLAIRILSENKSSYVFGIGPGQYGPYAQNNISADYGWTIVNNLPLEILLELGAIGLGLFVVFGLIILSKSYASAKKATDMSTFYVLIAMWAYLISQAVQAQTYSTIYVIYLWFPIGIVMGVLRSNNAKK